VGLSFAGHDAEKTASRSAAADFCEREWKVEALEAEKHIQTMPRELGHPWREARFLPPVERMEHAIAEWGATRGALLGTEGRPPGRTPKAPSIGREKLAAYEFPPECRPPQLARPRSQGLQEKVLSFK